MREPHNEQHSSNEPQTGRDSVPPNRDEFGNPGDTQLEATLEFATKPGAESAVKSEPVLSAGEWSGTGQRFRVLRRHAKGGLGEVFVAQDLELRREVALKEIQTQYADQPLCRSRFVLEAEITGGLEHPGIVPVYGLGQYADGRPFYAMRFIRGDSLRDAIERFHRDDVPGRDPGQRMLELRKLLGRFLDVCEAIGYAHSRGVLHRDLKPGNIMLGKFGETLVVDWGLAKVAANSERAFADIQTEAMLQPTAVSGSEPTALGSAIGTPAYMSPEQAAGHLDRLGQASDVYGLGATLYHLLTGEAPVAGKDVNEVLRKVQLGDFPAAAARNTNVPAAISAICGKAMALRPEDRYASPREMSDDLEHWLADEPVSCFAEPLAVRARRWMKRHRTVVASSAASLAVLVTSLVVLLGIILNHNHALDFKNIQLDEANTQLVQANANLQQANSAERAAKQDADEKRIDAEVARDETRQVLDYLVGAFRKPDPSADGEKLTVAELFGQATEQLETAFPNQPLIQAQLLHAIGDTYYGLGLYGKAIEAHERERDICRAHLADSHANLLSSTNSLAMDLVSAERIDEAIVLFQQTLDVQQKTLGPEHSNTLSTTNNLADAFRHAGKLAEAIQLLERTLESMQDKLGPENYRTLVVMDNLGITYQTAGQFEKAVLLHEKAYGVHKLQLGVEHPTTLTSMSNLAAAYASTGRLEDAIPLLQSTLELRTAKLGAKHPTTLMAMTNLALAYAMTKRLDEAIAHLDQALEQQKTQLGREHPDTLMSMANLAFAYESAGRRAEAIVILEQTLGLLKSKLGPQHPTTLRSMHQLAFLYSAAGRFVEAIPLQGEAYRTLKTTFGPDHSDTLTSMMNLGEAYLRANQPMEAIVLFEELVSRRTSLLGRDHQQVWGSATRLAESYRVAGRVDDAIRLYEKIRDDKIRVFGLEHPETQPTLSNLAGAYLTAGRTTEAIAQFEKLRANAAKAHGPDHPQTLTLVVNLATAYETAGRFAEAVALMDEARDASQRALGADHPETLEYMHALAVSCWKARRLDRSVPLFEDTYRRMKAVHGENHLSTIRAHANLGVNYKDAGRRQDGIACFEDALSHIRQLPQPFQTQFFWVQMQLADAYEESKQFAKAETLLRESLESVGTAVGTQSPPYAGLLAALGYNLLQQKRFDDAETILRACLAIRAAKMPDDWTTFNVQAMLGGSLLGQKRYADAEPLLVAGYEGLERRELQIPPPGKIRLIEALQQLVQLYADWEKPAQATQWKSKLEKRSLPPP